MCGRTLKRCLLPRLSIRLTNSFLQLMLMEAMRLSLLDQDRANNSNQQSNNVPSDSRPSDAGRSLRSQGGPTLSALATPLVNASNLVAVSTAMPSQRRLEAGGSPAPSARSPSPHTRTHSNPPPTSTLAAAIAASNTANAVLRTSETDTNGVTSPPSSNGEAAVETPPARSETGGTTLIQEDTEPSNGGPSTFVPPSEEHAGAAKAQIEQVDYVEPSKGNATSTH